MPADVQSESVSILVLVEHLLGRVVLAQAEGVDELFQSLFWWNISWVTSRCRRTFSPRAFQSLFWWNISWVVSCLPRPKAWMNCFNPCSGGTSPGSLADAGGRSVRERFNPCSGGTSPGSCRACPGRRRG